MGFCHLSRGSLLACKPPVQATQNSNPATGICHGHNLRNLSCVFSSFPATKNPSSPWVTLLMSLHPSLPPAFQPLCVVYQMLPFRDFYFFLFYGQSNHLCLGACHMDICYTFRASFLPNFLSKMHHWLLRRVPAYKISTCQYLSKKHTWLTVCTKA